ncbi:fibronectin type III domain-containing protein [Pontiella sulfatireligans]|uniref:Fibronectin type-III domain-containing protein n=1 Tax=Pontiella sulfatireligans TaxID=2750658 RepID=A0A6C2UF89_9BACT|nr:hypothetical protein [Pontiella sulfatireligans]VGO18589.1 hypothetical protein SCARR_00642 [Pontiella sulfatireligans]
MKIKRAIMAVLVGMGMISATWADSTIINTGFAAGDGYSDGDLAGQTDTTGGGGIWTQASDTLPNAFNVDATAGIAENETIAVTSGARTVYLSGATIGNAAKDEWTTVVDFTLKRDAAEGWANASIFTFGLSHIATNALSLSGQSDLTFSVGTEFSDNNIEIKSSVGDLSKLKPIEAGWDDSGAGATDLETEPLRLTAVLRKTSADGYYELSTTLENLTTGSNSVSMLGVVSATNAYQTAQYYLLQSSPALQSGAASDYFTASIDSLSTVLTNNVDLSELVAPVVAVVPGVGQVDLSWDSIVEADQYVVQRTAANVGIGGPYTDVVATITTNGYQDTAVLNGNLYYYIVTATNTATGVSADSDPVAGMPDAPAALVTGAFIDTTFTNTAIYANGDLAAQDKWRANFNTLANAFTVETAGDGFATGLSTVANTNDATVFWRDYSTNNVGAVWSGTLGFKVSVANAPTVEKVVGGVTNQVAVLTAEEAIFDFGLTSNTEGARTDPDDSDDAVITLYQGDDGEIRMGLNARYWSLADFGDNGIQLTAEELGWDPAWNNPSNSVPDFQTDLVELEWSIRKSTNEDYAYSSTIIATVGGNSITSDVKYCTGAYNAGTLWEATTANFVMAHQSPNPDLTEVSVDYVSVAHTNASEVPIIAPRNLASSIGNLSVNLAWALTGQEATGFDIYRSATNESTFILYESNVTNALPYLYVDAGLDDKRVYLYKIKAKFPGGDSDFSEIEAVRALGVSNALGYDPKGALTGGAFNLSKGTGIVSNDVVLFTGGGLNGSWVDETYVKDWEAGTDTWDTNAAPLVYGWVQHDNNDGGAAGMFVGVRDSATQDNIRMKSQGNASLLYVNGGPLDATAQTYTLEGKSANWDSTARPAVRNGSTWYACDTVFNNNVDQSFGDLSTLKWASFSAPAPGDTFVTMPASGDAAYTTRSLDNVTAVGWLREHNELDANRSVAYIRLLTGTTTTAYENWTFGYGIYNEDASSTGDYDNDGINNVTEWGLGGNPANDGNQGIQNHPYGVDDSGGFIYIHPALESWLTTGEPTYTVLENANLVHTDFTDESSSYTINIGGEWSSNRTDFVTVTNIIPAADAVKFFGLEVTE